MTNLANTGAGRVGKVRILAWSGAAALILLPLLAMKFTSEVNWDMEDFTFAIFMIGGVGLAFELAVRVSRNWSYRAGFALALLAAFLLVWGNLAVGFIGSEDNPINGIYFGVVAIALAGSLISLLKPKGMALTMAVTGAAQILAGLVALYLDYFTGPLTIFFTGLWLASARLFHKAAKEGSA
jgi:hypothetical protein